MNLQEKSFIELHAMFQAVVLEWQANNSLIKRIKEKECERYNDFVRCRADLRHFSKENAMLHNKLVQIDLEMQIRVWSGKND